MSFPTEPVLDTFDRADGPLGSNWTIDDYSGNTISISSDTAVADSTPDAAATYFWNPLADLTDCEVYVTLATVPSPIIVGQSCSLVARGAIDESQGIFLLFEAGGAVGSWEFVDSAGSFDVTGDFAEALVDGDKFGIQVVGDQATAWLFHGGGWSVLTVQTTGVAGGGLLGMGLITTDDGTAGYSFDDFGGGGGGGPPPGVPVCVDAPVIDGLPTPGHTLASSTGVWTGAPTSFAYQWNHGGTPIGGATSSTYLLDDSYVGETITVTVTATNDTGPSSGCVSDGVVVFSVAPAAIPYQSPPWRFVILDLQTFETLSFLDHLASSRVATFILDQPAQATMSVPSDNPEVNIPWPMAGDDPFLAEGTRVLLGFRREGINGSGEGPWKIRFAGMILQLEDGAQSDNATTAITAFDPWQYIMSRPIVNGSGNLPGTTGLSFTATKANVIAGTLLKNTIDHNGPVGIDFGTSYGGTAFWTGVDEDCDPIDINFAQGGYVGEAWNTLVSQGLLDIYLEPIYDPHNRPGYLVQGSFFTQAGEERDDAIFAWDMPSRSLVQIDRLTDGTVRANKVKFFAGQAGLAPGGQTIAVQTDAASVTKFGEYWRQQMFPSLNVAGAVGALAAQQLALSKDGKVTVTINPAPERSPIPWRDYWLGDRVPVYASSRLRQAVQGFQRVYGVPVTISDNGTETIQQLLTAVQES